MKKITQGATRLLVHSVFALTLFVAICAIGRASAEECIFSNADADTTAAVRQDGSYGSTSITFQLSNPSGSAVSSTTFPSTGTVLLSKISLCARANMSGYNGAKTVRLTGGTSGRVFTGTITYLNGANNGAFTIGIGSDTWTRSAIQILFDGGMVPVDVTENYTLTFLDSSGNSYTLGYSVVDATTSNQWKPAMRIYGAKISGSSPETTLAGTPITVASSGVNLRSNGKLIHFSVFMKVSNIPETSGRIFAWKDGENHEMFLSKTSTGFKQGWLNDSGADQGGSWGSGNWTYDSGDHWVAVVYDEGVKNSGSIDTQSSYAPLGSYSYIDGEAVAGANGLRFLGRTVPTLTIGGASLNNADVATDMVIKEAYQCSEPLTAAQVATVTKALQKGWTLTSSGVALNGTSVQLPDRSDVVTGIIFVALDGSYTFSGTLPSSVFSGVQSTATVAVDNIYNGVSFANDGSVVIGNEGVQIALSSSLPYCTVMMKVSDIPSSACRLLGWTLTDTIESFVSYTGSQFEQHYLSNGTVNGTTYGKSSWTRDASEHWVAVTYARKDNESGSSQSSGGTRTYLDGLERIARTDLKWSTSSTAKVTIGGTSTGAASPATGMVVRNVLVFSNALTAKQMKFVTAALQKGWTVNAAGTTLTGTAVQLPDSDTGTVTGTLTVASDGTWTFNGSVVSGTVTLPTGSTVTAVPAGTTVRVKASAPATLEEAIVGGYSLSATLTVPETVDGTLVLTDVSGNIATGAGSSYSAGVRTFTGTAPANATYAGSLWWWDYEFNEDPGTWTDNNYYRLSTPNEGSADNVQLNLESTSNPLYTSADVQGNRELYFQQTPWRNATFSTLTEMTAVMYCAPGNYANTVLVGFGSTTANDNDSIAIALVTGTDPSRGDMKLVLISGADRAQTTLANLKATDATTQKHLYAFVVDRIDGNTKTRVRVYLDGKVKAIYKHNGVLVLSNGFQIGSLHGGVSSSGSWDTGLSKYSSSGNSGTLDFLRVINGSLSDDAMVALANAYSYESAHGEATRDPVSGSANTWISTDAWTQKVPNQSDATQDAPNADTNVKLSIDGSSAVSVALNLEDDSNYESVTFSKEAGATGSLKVTSAYNNATTGKLVSAETSVLVDTTVPAGRVHLGITSVGDGVTLTIDPYSMTGSYLIYSKLAELPLGGVWEDEIISMALLGEGASVTLGSQTTLNNLGFSATLVYNESNQSYTYRLVRESASSAGAITATANADGSVTWVTHNVVLPAPETIPFDYANTVTIDASAYDGTITIPTAFAGGNVTVAAGGSVNLTGAITTSGTVALNTATTLSGNTVSCALTGSGAVTINDTVTIADGGSIANTINGSGTIDCSGRSSKPGAFTFGTWTGTVVLPELASIAGDTFSFNNYGIEGSTVRVNGIGGGWLKSEEVNPTIDIPATKTITISDFSASFVNTFKALSGAGTFAVTYNTAIDTTSGSWYSNYSAYFLIKNISNFTGSLTTATPGIVIGSAKPEYRTTGGKIILTTSATIATGKTWTATGGIVLADAGATLTNTDGALDPAPTTTVANSYVKLTDSTYSVDAYNTVTFTVANATYTRTDALGNAIKDGDTITFTVAPDANYGVSSVTATSGEVTNDDGTYSYVVTSDATITIEIVRTHVQLTIPAVEHATAAVTVGGEAAPGSSPYTVPYQSNVTVTWTPASGYKITSGASQTINSIAADTTADSPTVEAKGATVSGVTFDYGADFATARVTATVSGDATTYTLTVDGANYEGAVDGTTVTFSNVVTGHSSAYDSVSYEITATDGTSSVVVSGGSGSAVAADTTAWFSQSSANSGNPVNGSWTTEVNLSTPTNVTDNTFAATSPSTSSRVVLEFNVCFSSTSEDDVSGEAQAAIKLGVENDATTFMVLTNGNNWAAVSNAELTPNASATYNVVLTIDYGSNAYGVTVGNYVLTNSAGSASFPLAANRTSVQNIDFAGSGTLTSLKGDQVEGYMVKDGQNHYYATIEAATQAYNSANGPYTVLHDGTAPSGWKIDEATKNLIKVAKGLFFMAY